MRKFTTRMMYHQAKSKNKPCDYVTFLPCLNYHRFVENDALEFTKFYGEETVLD